MKKTQLVLTQIRNAAGIVMVVAAMAFTQSCSSDGKKESRTEDAMENTGDAMKADANEATADAKDNMNEAGNDFERERKEAVANLNQEKDKMDANIDELKAKMKNENAKAKVKSQEKLDKLEADRKELGNDIDKAQNATADAWQDVKGGFKKAGRNIGDAFDRAGDKIDGKN